MSELFGVDPGFLGDIDKRIRAIVREESTNVIQVQVVEVTPVEPRLLTVRTVPGAEPIPIPYPQTDPTYVPPVGAWLWADQKPGGLVIRSRGGSGGDGGGGVTAHGELTGLGEDHHLQYLTNGRGDGRYAPASHVSSRSGHPTATATQQGFLAGGDKARLDGLTEGIVQQSYPALSFTNGVDYELATGWTHIPDPQWSIPPLGAPPSGTQWKIDAVISVRMRPNVRDAGYMISLGLNGHAQGNIVGGASCFVSQQTLIPVIWRDVSTPSGASTDGFTVRMSAFVNPGQSTRFYSVSALTILIQAVKT